MIYPLRTERLRSPDAAWLHMDGPTNRMTVVGLLTLGRPLDLGEARRLVGRRLLAFDRFSQRIDLEGRPRWVTHADFDIDRHVHRVPQSGPLAKEDVRVLVETLVAEPVDLSIPPWQMHLIEAYDGGSAILVQVHHALADGIALVHVLLSLADEHFHGIDWSTVPDYGREAGTAGPTWPRRVGRAIVSGARRLGHGVRHPSAILGLVSDATSFAAASGRIAFLRRDSETRFKGEPGIEKSVAWSPAIALDDVRDVASRHAAKINDVLMAAVAGGIRRYLLERGEPVDDIELGTVIPVNLRPMRDAYLLGNEFGIVFLRLPMGIADPVARLNEVQRRMDKLKASAEPVVSMALLRVMGAGPAFLHRAVVNRLSNRSSLVITNVPGPNSTLHLGGRAIRDVMFWVPRAGSVGLGVSILSYAGLVRLGVAVDAVMAEADGIVAALVEELQALR